MKTILSIKEIEKIVDKFPTKDKDGFTATELNELLKDYHGISTEDLLKQMGVVTAKISLVGEGLFYHRDVKNALRRCAQIANKASDSRWKK